MLRWEEGVYMDQHSQVDLVHSACSMIDASTNSINHVYVSMHCVNKVLPL